MTRRELPVYETDENTRCSDCGENCRVVPLENEFDYAGTHCTGGSSGTHYPPDWGNPVSDCCEAETYEDDEE